MDIVWRRTAARPVLRDAKQRVQAMLQANMCVFNDTSWVDAAYVMRKWQMYDLILMVGSTGFLVGYFKQDDTFPGKGFYIDVVCSTGHGKMLIAQAETLARQQSCQYVELMALPHVLLYYDTLGYRHLYLKRVIKALPWPYGTKNRAKEICKAAKGKRVNVTNVLLTEMPSLLLFFQRLHELNMGVCKRPQVPSTRSEFIKSECGKDGYVMRKLLP
jgi:hypothetical protein